MFWFVLKLDTVNQFTSSVSSFKINNAGISSSCGKHENIENINMESYDQVIDINVRAVVELTHYCIKHLIQTKGI